MARPGRPRKTILDPHSAAQLEHTLKSLARSGASKFFYQIRRRIPGKFQFPFWKRNVPVEEVDDIREYCYGEGGDQYEYKIEVRDGNGLPVNGPDGEQLSDSMIPAAKEPEKTQLPAPDPILEGRRKELEARRQEVELTRQEAELERQKKRVDAIRRGEDPDDEDDDSSYNPYDPRFFNPYMMSSGMGYPGMGGYVPPWMQNQQQGSKREDTLLLALIEAIKDKKPEAPKESFFELLMKAKASGLLGEQMNFKDMAQMFSPFMMEMGKISSEGNKLLMQNLAESDRAFRERVLDLVMASGADDDDVEKWKKILGLVTDTAQQGIKLVLGRSSIVKGGGDGGVKVPIVKKPTPPGLPSPKGKPGESSPEGGVDSEIEEAKASPNEAARRIIRERVSLFLVAQEQEMLVGSDPVWAADKLDEVWASLPDPLRVKLEGLEIDRIYDELKSIAPEIVDRILKEVAEDESGNRKQWCLLFWDAMKTPPEYEEGEEEEGEEEEEVREPEEEAGGGGEKPEGP